MFDDEASLRLCRPEIATLLQEGAGTFRRALEPVKIQLALGAILMQMGEAHDYLYVVDDGWFARTRTIEDGRRQIMVLFLAGDVCGIKTIFLQHQPDAIEAVTAAAARRIHYRAANQLAARHYAVALYLAWQLARDERHLHNWNVRLGRGNAEERIAALLLELRDRLRFHGIDPRGTYPLPVTQQQIADHVGLTVVHVNRVLRRFRELDMVSVQRGRMVFLSNIAGLEALARPVQDLVA